MLVEHDEPVKTNGKSGREGQAERDARRPRPRPSRRRCRPPAAASQRDSSSLGAPSRAPRARARKRAAPRSAVSNRSMRLERRATSMPAGIVRRPASPSSNAAQARRLLLDVRAASCGRWDGAADHAGHRDQGQDVGQAPGRGRTAPATAARGGTRARSTPPKSSAAAKAPNGRQFPKMTAASAM